ncbi:MAG: DUF6230 family protein [Promicromonosporaceae bacterium]|nr:DUF6230 family protein [Promicromonosporaceae bacterium]
MNISKLTKTRGGRVLLAAVPTAVVLAMLGGGVAQGVVPVSFAVSGSTFKIRADELDGTGFSQYAGVAQQKDGTQHPVAIANIKSAELHNLCQSMKMPGLPISLLIHAGQDPKHPVTASDLQIGMDNLGGDATFDGIRIGVDASTVSTDAKGTAGDFAMDSTDVKIMNLKQVSWSTQASVFNLVGLKLNIDTSGAECF